MPLDLDGYLFDGWENGKASQVHALVTADFRDWESSYSKCEQQIEKVIRALRADENAREQPPTKIVNPLSPKLSTKGVRNKVGGCAGINRHVAGDERALQERRERLHPDPESCRRRREAGLEA